MAGRVKAQRATITLADGRVLEVTVANPDMVRWDQTAHRHGWPGMQDAPMLWATFVTWRAATRMGLYTDKWEKWSDEDCLQVDLDVPDEDAVDDGLDPTRPGVAPGSV